MNLTLGSKNRKFREEGEESVGALPTRPRSKDVSGESLTFQCQKWRGARLFESVSGVAAEIDVNAVSVRKQKYRRGSGRATRKSFSDVLALRIYRACGDLDLTCGKRVNDPK